ncbi:cyclic nucleotide-binding domain-containing protein [Sarocladium implicatum]|nr:cyclic nucleotide-binding domain-containing protein [Sarocladium implicatum]
MPSMRRGRHSGSTSPFRAIAHQQQATGQLTPKDSLSLIRSFDDASLSSRPIRPSPLTTSTIKDMPLDLLDRIRTFPLFLSAPEDFLVEIGAHLKPQIVTPNEHILTEGDDARAMYWLVRGVVAVTSRDGETVYAELKAGAFFGEIGVLMDMPRTATIVSRSKCLLLVLKKEDLQAVMPKYPEMEKAIREEATERLNLLKKKRNEGGTAKAVASDAPSRDAAPGQVSTGESGVIRDGAVLNSKKRKSPSPGIIEDPTVGSVIGSGYVNIRMTLKDFPLFSNLPPDPLHFLGLSVQPRTYHPFNDIVRQGSTGNEIYFIVQGEAEVIHESQAEKGGPQEFSRSFRSRPRLKAGQYFGEVVGLGLSSGRTATVRSITTVECLMIPGDALDELWRRLPPGIKAQMEETARLRYEHKQDDVEMVDADVKEKTTKSVPSTPVKSTFSLPHLTFTTPSKSGSAANDEAEVVERKDPDPYLSVDMENLRSRRRHSLAPPTTQLDMTTPPPTGLRSRQSGSSLNQRPHSIAIPDLEMEDVPAKRPKPSPRYTGSSKIPSISDELLLKILENLDVGQLMRLRCVSGHWRRLLSSSPRLCHHLDLTLYNRQVTDQVLADWIAPFVGTRAITADLSNCFHVTDAGFSALVKLCGKNIRQWKMRSVWDVSANQILDMAEQAKGLEEVDWSNCRKVGDNLLCRVVGWVIPDTPPQSKQVVISSSKKGKGQTQQQQRAHNMPPPGTVIGCPKLTRLNLSYCKHITDRSMAHLAAHASNRLQSLSLTRCTTISDNGFQSWSAYKFEKLTTLCLADCTYLTDNAIVALVNAAKNLTSLDLSFCCALSDTATEVVALGLPRLRELRLAFCGSAVSDASLESVALHLSELNGISVRGCVRVTGKGVESILSSCSRLQWVDVSQCRNLEPWFNAGGVARWGYNERNGEGRKESKGDASAYNGLPQGIRAMSVAMLTSSSFSGRAGGVAGRRTRGPVKFMTEKGFDGLR